MYYYYLLFYFFFKDFILLFIKVFLWLSIPIFFSFLSLHTFFKHTITSLEAFFLSGSVLLHICDLFCLHEQNLNHCTA